MKTSLLRSVLSVTLAASCSLASGQATNPYEDFRAKTYQVQHEYLAKITAHQVAVMKDLEQKLEQQQWQTTAISILVILMVLSGIALAALQFYADYRNKGKSSISVKIGAGSFELNSSVIGIAILAFSMWFFNSYIERVYSVQIVNIQPIDVTTFGVNR